MVSVEKPCPIAVAKELWEALQPVFAKHGANESTLDNVCGIIVVAVQKDGTGSVTVIGEVDVADMIKQIVRKVLADNDQVVIPLG